MGTQAQLRAVNREVRTFPKHVQECATVELARSLARECDMGIRAASIPLMKALDQLRKLAQPPRVPAGASARPGKAPADVVAVDEAPEEVTDELDDLARARAARLAGASGVVRPIGGDVGRSGGRAAR